MLKKSLLGGAIVLCGAGAAHAADVIDTAPVADWSGFYVGVNGGYGWGNFDYNASLSEATTGGDRVNLGHGGSGDGFIAGVQAGYNWQMDSVVLGIEGDINKSWMSSSNNSAFTDYGANLYSGTARTETDLDWFGTARLRAGFLATDALLIYGTGGLAWGNVDSHVRVDINGDGINDVSGGSTDNRWGWTLGGGVEYKVSEAVSIKAEYLYVNLGEDNVINRDVLGNDVRAKNDANFSTIRAGINFHF